MGNKNLTRHIGMGKSQWLGLGQNVNHEKLSFDVVIRYRVMGCILLLIGLLILTGLWGYSNRFAMVAASVCLLLGNLFLIKALEEIETIQQAINLEPAWARLASYHKGFDTENAGDKMHEVVFLGTLADDEVEAGTGWVDLEATSLLRECSTARK